MATHVDFITVEDEQTIHVDPDHVEQVSVNARDNDESSILHMTSGKTVAVQGTTAAVLAKLGK